MAVALVAFMLTFGTYTISTFNKLWIRIAVTELGHDIAGQLSRHSDTGPITCSSNVKSNVFGSHFVRYIPKSI